MGDAVTSGLGFAASAVRFVARLVAVKDETGVVLSQIKVVTDDIVEAERLYLQKRRYLSDGDQSRVVKVIRNAESAVHRIHKEVEPARKSVVRVGTINGFDRIDWILRRSGSTETYQHSLDTCHRSLLDRISMLRHVRSNISDHFVPSPERSPLESRSESPQVQSNSDGSDEDDSENIKIKDGNASSKITPTSTVVHPERALYEATQRNHTRKLQKPRTIVHPERLLYEEMQKRYA